MSYGLYYANTLQKEEPETISMDTVKFIINDLIKNDKKVYYKNMGKDKTLSSWLNGKGTSTVIIKHE
jgi:DNA primase catalytic subunit